MQVLLKRYKMNFSVRCDALMKQDYLGKTSKNNITMAENPIVDFHKIGEKRPDQSVNMKRDEKQNER